MSITTIQPFAFHEQTYIKLDDLVNAMGMHWNEGRQLLFSGKLREATRKYDASFANSCASAEKELQMKPDAGNRIFLRWLCKFPGIRGLYWQGKNYGGIRQIYQTLTTKDETLQKLLFHMLKEQYMSTFVKNTGSGDQLAENIRYLEKTVGKSDQKYATRSAIPILAYLLSGKMTFSFAGRQFDTPMDFARFLQTYADTSKESLSHVIQPLFMDDHCFAPQFEAWIIARGYHHELTLWKGRFQDGQTGPDEPADNFFDVDRDISTEARQLSDPEFEKSLEGFEDAFLKLLKENIDTLDLPDTFMGLMDESFPENKLQSYLLTALYRMDIVKAIRDADDLTESLTEGFEKRLIQDYGVKPMFAKWAVSEWRHCYGEQILGKRAKV